ncbi:MAG: flagellar motor switch protein FliN, partial [Chloroflexota bacterium]|nr:flagellar motor switch protein FliN [Chloroflexota bacterium]
ASTVAAAAVPAEFVGLFLTAQAELRLNDGSTSGALIFLGEDEASMLFNVSPADAANEEEYTAKLEEAVHTTLSDLSDFLTLSVSVNSGAQMQFGIGEVHLYNLAQNPLELPANMAGGNVLVARLELVAEDTPPMVVSYVMSTNDLPAVLGSVDGSAAAPAVSAAAPPPVAAAPAAGISARPQPQLTPLPTGQQTAPEPVVRPAQFTSFGSQAEGSAMANIDLILDVSLRVTVELGRKLMSVRDILALGPGSVVELDKLAGEPVDVLVNDRLIATGEVVVADENFGVRITDIVNPAKRLSSR